MSLSLRNTPLVRVAVTVGIVAAAAYALSSVADFAQVLSVLGRADPVLVVLATGVFYVTFTFQALRWSALLREAGAKPDVRSGTQILFLNWFVNVCIPARAGDVYRCYLAKDRYGCQKAMVLGTIASERTLDMALLAVGTAIGTTVLFGGLVEVRNSLITMTGGVLALILVGVSALSVGHRRVPESYRELWLRFKSGFRWVRTPRTSATVVLLTGCIWALNALRFGLVSMALSVELNAVTIVYVALLIGFLSGIPVTPAGIGILELVSTTVLIGAGVSGTMGASMVLLDRIITIGTVVCVGLVAYPYLKHVSRSWVSL